MEKRKLKITDERMLQLPDILLQEERINYKQDFFNAINIVRQNINNIKNGTQHFTVDQILSAGKIFGINMNWIFGFHDESPFIKNKKSQLIKQGESE